MTPKTFLAGVLFSVYFLSGIHAYTVVLKNGKTIRGTFVSSDGEKLVLKDSKGVQLSFKKAMVDMDKTNAANSMQTQKVSESQAPVSQTAPHPAPKPAHVVNESDLKKWRENHDLGQKTFSKQDDEDSEYAESPEA